MNRKADSFFGRKDQYERIDELVQICIPEVVIDEIKRHKFRYLGDELKKYRDNFFVKRIGFELDDSLDLEVEEIVEDLYANSNAEFSYNEITLEQYEVLPTIKNYAIENQAPFEEKSDKGFKDAYIHFTILEYLASNQDKVYLITNDGRLKLSFDNNKRVTVLKDLGEYYSYREDYFREPYFIEKLQEYYGDTTITSTNVENVILNDDDNWELTLDIGEQTETLLIDFFSKEILDE